MSIAVYVTHNRDNTLSAISGDQLIATIPVGNNPLEPAIATDGTVYITNKDDNTVSVIRYPQLNG